MSDTTLIKPFWSRVAWTRAAAMLFFSLLGLGLSLRLLFAFSTDQYSRLALQDWWDALFWGMRYDAGIAGVLMIILFPFYYLLARFHLAFHVLNRCWLALPISLLYLAQIGDLLYAQESGRHISYEIVEVIRSADSLLAMLPHYFVFFIPLPMVIWWAARVSLPRARAAQQSGVRSDIRMVLICGVCAIAVRGGVTSLPMSPNDVLSLGDEPVSLTAMNGAYSVAYAIMHPHRARAMPAAAAMSEDYAREVLQSFYGERAPTSPTPKQYNIVLLFLESWPAEFMKSYGYSEDVTPFFDQLRQKSLTTDAMIAGGNRTVEGVFTTLCSYQNPEGFGLPVSQLFTREYRCLPRYLADKGYQTVFYQGMHWNSAKLGAMAKKLGYQNVQGKEAITFDLTYPPNNWGVHDIDLYRHVLAQRKTMKEPHFITLNTTSTHDEVIPDAVKPVFGFSTSHEKLRSLMHFSDQQLQFFVSELTSQPLSLPTILIAVADHTARVNTSPLNRYRIPFLIYAPDIVKPQQLALAASQRDIAPTILDVLGDSSPAFTGRSLLQPMQTRAADFQYSGHLGWIEGEQLIRFRLADKSNLNCYQWRRDFLLQKPQPCTDSALRMQDRALAFSRRSSLWLFAGKTGEMMQDLMSPKK